MAKITEHPAVWIGGTIAALVLLCRAGKLPIPWLCMGIEGIKDPRNWSADLSTGQWLFGGGRDIIGKQLVMQQSGPFNYVNSFNPFEIKTTDQNYSGPVGTIVGVKMHQGNKYVLLTNNPLGQAVYAPITSNAQPT